ncbi:hypothetical protein FHX45_003171 [Amycolatopsis granulosa]|nr:hypothetical protein [Amycolatopsis granulosa]
MDSFGRPWTTSDPPQMIHSCPQLSTDLSPVVGMFVPMAAHRRGRRRTNLVGDRSRGIDALSLRGSQIPRRCASCRGHTRCHTSDSGPLGERQPLAEHHRIAPPNPAGSKVGRHTAVVMRNGSAITAASVSLDPSGTLASAFRLGTRYSRGPGDGASARPCSACCGSAVSPAVREGTAPTPTSCFSPRRPISPSCCWSRTLRPSRTRAARSHRPWTTRRISLSRLDIPGRGRTQQDAAGHGGTRRRRARAVDRHTASQRRGSRTKPRSGSRCPRS